MNPPRLSIVVPFYNVERYIADCLDSLARQTYRDFEVILVDDGSKDASVDAARDFCARDRRFRLVTQENQGLGPARNTGVGHAQGDYLTFVDSDDLVPRHAYEIMVRSLDETSSSLAAGNARRFNNTSGVRQSFVHRAAFASNLPATHVFDHPALALDRMVWNKVYRRTFWDQFAYEFPAIRYEDYPVTLRSHIEAVTVDCIAAPVYYWRERESGESITQQKFQYGNLADRVRSAEMVLDVVDQKAPELIPRVHRHLLQIDLATIVQAFGTADDDELEPLVTLGRRLSSRLDAGVLAKAATLARLEYEALEARDADLLRRLAQFRAETGTVAARRDPRRPWRFESQYPGLHDSRLPADVFSLPRGELELRTAVTGLDWTADDLVIRGTAEIFHLPARPGATLSISLVSGRRPYRLPVEIVPSGRLGEDRPLAFVTRISRKLLAALPGWADTATLKVHMRNGWVRRSAALMPGNFQYPMGDWVGDVWVQPTRPKNGRLTLQLRTGAAELTAAAVEDDHLVLTGRLPRRLKNPAFFLTRSAGDMKVPLTRRPGGPVPAATGRRRAEAMDGYEVRIPLGDVVDKVNPDDPFLGRSVLVPRLQDGDEKLLLLVTGLRKGLFVPRGDRVVSITRSPGQYLNLVEGPARVTADKVELSPDGTKLTVSGPRWPGVTYEGITWRRFLPNSDDGIDAPCRLVPGADRWAAEADLGDMTGDGERPNWTLFADPGRITPYAVQSDTFLLAHLPLRAGPFVLFPHSGILHLETD